MGVEACVAIVLRMIPAVTQRPPKLLTQLILIIVRLTDIFVIRVIRVNPVTCVTRFGW